MIYDKIDNIGCYLGISKALDTGLKYISNIDSTVPNGTHLLDFGIKVIVSEYESVPYNPNGYEAHRQYIDIQFPIRGSEIIRCNPIDRLKTTMDYDLKKDCVLFEDDGRFCTECKIGNGYFAILFPDDAHEPQLCIDEPEYIKKIILKIPVK